MGKTKSSKVIYTAIFGDYSGLIPQPKLSGYDYFCFTDNPNLKESPWEIILIDTLPVENDMTRSNRYYKILPHLFFKEYELSIYIDGNIWVKGNLDQMINKYLGGSKMLAFSHEFTYPDSRNCIYQEYKAILNMQKEGNFKDDEGIMEEHMNFLISQDFPENSGLIKGSCLVRLHNDEEVIKLMQDWWWMVSNYSKRDQLSFNFVAWKNNFCYSIVPGDLRKGNPYIHWLGPHRKNWKKKLWKLKFKKTFGLL